MIKPSLVLLFLIPGLFFCPAVSGSDNSDSSGVITVSPPNDDIYQPRLDDGTPWTYATNIKPGRLAVLLGGIIIADIIGFNRLADTWYITETTSFHFHEWSRDSREYKQMDKIGHVMDSYFMSHLASKGYRWSGISAKKSILYGSLTGFLWMLQIEIADSFFKDWGFSYIDLTANVIGSGYAALQQLYPDKLMGIRLKVSYRPSNAYKNKEYSEVSQSIVDDYEGMTFWLAVNVHDVLPQPWQRSMPGWLSPWGIAVGQSVTGIAKDVFGGKREVFIGLDFDLTKIPTGNSKFLKFTKDMLNFVRMPLPAIRITPDTIVYGFYF